MALKVYNGSTWVEATPKIYNGSTWVTLTTGQVYNGSGWSTWYSGSTATITLVDFDVTSSFSPALCRFDVSDGSLYTSSNLGEFPLFTWIDDPSAAGSYEIRATRTSGNGPTINLNTWLPLTEDRQWGTGTGSTFKQNVLLLEIRLASTGVVQESCVATLTYEGDGGATVTL